MGKTIKEKKPSARELRLRLVQAKELLAQASRVLDRVRSQARPYSVFHRHPCSGGFIFGEKKNVYDDIASTSSEICHHLNDVRSRFNDLLRK